MIVNADAKALEWLCAVYLSKDKVGYEEILNNVDQHTQNQSQFGLPSRDVAKRFVFRLIYGGGAFSYANDNMFSDISTKESFWQGVIDKFYKKYSGIHDWHQRLEHEAMSTGLVRIPTGRCFRFVPLERRGKLVWPRTQILNYPVQGLGADLMVLARVGLWRRLRKRSGILFVATVHDSVVLDVDPSQVPFVVESLYKTWEELPTDFERYFEVPFDLPTKVEVSSGPNWKEQTKEDYVPVHRKG